jgi:hypothetical protein
MPHLGFLIYTVAVAATAPSCRCTSPAACWDAVPWASLNASVGGRLFPTGDPLSPCQADAGSASCAAALASSDDEFWLSSFPGGYLHTGTFGQFNLTTVQSAFAVDARSEGDVSATVAFAQRHNLRLVIKSTGHDWYARSTSPGSLLLWTHGLSSINFIDAFTCTGCPAGTPRVPAVAVGAGVQFRELYDAAQLTGKLVIGGTCDSVSVGGCWLGGCFGSFSRVFGTGAANILELRLVLANGTSVTVNEVHLPDLFWGMKGGGLGLAGVVVSYVARAHPAPLYVTTCNLQLSAMSASDFLDLAEAFLLLVDGPLASSKWGSGGFSVGGLSISFSAHGYNRLPADCDAALAPIKAWVSANPSKRFNVSSSAPMWNASTWAPGASFPWMEVHPDREISTAIGRSFSRMLPLSMRNAPGGARTLAGVLLNSSLLQPPASGPNASRAVSYWMADKTQGGLVSPQLEQFLGTSLNPVLLDGTALYLYMLNIPSLPTVPPSPALAASLLPRLKNYAILSPADPLWALCSDAAAGNVSAASACIFTLTDERVPWLQEQAEVLRAALYAALPNVHPQTGAPLSMSYVAETNFLDEDWAVSQWGANYARLKAIKLQYDSEGLFVCHHCVGSENWVPPEYNCRVAAKPSEE